MKRKFEEYGLDRLKTKFPEIADSEVRIFFDTDDKDQLAMMVHDIIKPYNEKFRLILVLILKNQYLDHLYKIEDTNVTAIKFIGKKYNNARIYCKEIFKNGKKVVMISPYFKKVQKNKDDPHIKKIIEDIKSYEYEI